jgi:hypothetical protein
LKSFIVEVQSTAEKSNFIPFTTIANHENNISWKVVIDNHKLVSKMSKIKLTFTEEKLISVKKSIWTVMNNASIF